MQKRKAASLQNITLSAEADLIARARERARAAKTTLNEEFRNWLRQFARDTKDKRWYQDFMSQFDDIDLRHGKKLSREEFYDE